MKRILIISCLLLFVVVFTDKIVFAEEFFNDSFESGDLSHTNSGTVWMESNTGAGDEVIVTSELSHSGSYSLKFHYAGSTNLNDDAWAEQRFHFGEGKQDFYVRYYIYFPSNYTIRNVSPNNNKFIVFWADDVYSGPMSRDMESWDAGTLHQFAYKARVSGWPLALTCSGSNGFYTGGDRATIAQDMLGNWTCFEHHIKVETADEPGVHQFWINGVLVIDDQDLSWAGGPCSPGYLNNGYLMGWANSGFNVDTDIYIDDVVFSDSYIGPMDMTPPGDGQEDPLPAPILKDVKPYTGTP